MEKYNFKTYCELFEKIKLQNNPKFLNYIKNNRYKNISTEEFIEKVEYLVYALKEYKIQKNHNIGIYLESSPSWLIIDFALQIIGANSVPIFKDISNTNLNHQINDANIQYIFIDNELSTKIKSNLTIFTIEKKKDCNNIYLNDLYKQGKKLSKLNKYDINALIKQVKESDTFSIIYTSGSTSYPKGVELTHKNIISQLHNINKEFNISNKDKALSLLPLAHIFQRTVMSFYLSHGISIYFLNDLTKIGPILKDIKPNIITLVPRLLEKIFKKIELNISEKNYFTKFISTLALKRALRSDINKNHVVNKLYNKLIYSKLRDIFGGELKILISGGSNLNKDIYNFFINIGINLYQGYGLTETSPVICVNTPRFNKVNTCGKVLNNIKVKLEKDGELLVKGPNIMKGYFNNKKLTKTILHEDGWLYTGDLAKIDNEGFIQIIGRKKELYKTSTGKYVNPIFIEQELTKSYLIDYALIIANNRKYVTALIFIDNTIYKNYIKKQNINITIEQFIKKDIIENHIKNHIKNININLNKSENIIKYVIITKQPTIENEELTSSMKIRRNIVENRYKIQINKMY